MSLRAQETVATPGVFCHPDKAKDPVVSYAVQFVDDNGQECSEHGLGKHFAAEYEECTSKADKVNLVVKAVTDSAASWGRLQ